MPAPAPRPGGIGFEEQGENERERVGRTRGRKNFTLVFHQTGDRVPQSQDFFQPSLKEKNQPTFCDLWSIILGQNGLLPRRDDLVCWFHFDMAHFGH